MAKRIKNRPEEDLQKDVAQLLDLGLPKDAVWWHTPNQRGTRSAFENKLLKAMGVRSGFPDIGILWRGKLLLIELKPKGRSLSDAQRELHPKLESAGATVTTCKSTEAVSLFLAMQMGSEWRARVAA